MKKSLEDAKKKAIEISKKHPNVACSVMDKKWEKAVVCCSGWVYKERILDGWKEIGRYVNGEEVKNNAE